jgi:hypothetical protein
MFLIAYEQQSPTDANDSQIDQSMEGDDKVDLLIERNRRLKNKVISLQASQKKKDRQLRNMKRKGVCSISKPSNSKKKILPEKISL